MKKIIKKIICVILKIIIPIIALVSLSKSCKDTEKYEREIKKLYNPKPYSHKKYINKVVNPNIDLSIIIPVYNSEKYLKECLDSIFNNKTKYKYEVICINDGSTDKSLEILEKYKKNHKNLIIINQDNSGAASARNKGLDNAVGKYIAFIDSDDYIANNYIEKLLGIAIKQDTDIVKCGYYRTFDKKQDKIYGLQLKCNEGLKNNILKIEGFLWMCVIKRELLFDIRLPEGYWYEDMIVRSLILHKCKKFIGIKDCLYYYRQHDKNISKIVEHSTDYRCLSQYYLSNYIIEYAKAINLRIDNNFKLIMLIEHGIMSYSRLNKLEKKIKKQIFYLSSKRIKYLNFNKQQLLNFSNKYFYKAFKKENYFLYKLIALYTKWQ